MLTLGQGVTRVMGVVNLTPDSFHAASRSPRCEEGVRRGLDQLNCGAAIVDVGGESTRPGAKPVPLGEELARVIPVIERLAQSGPVSIDTCKAEVARRAVAAGAMVVNDVSGGLLDRAMAKTVAELGVPVIVGHIRGTPETMQQAPSYQDAVSEVLQELEARLEVFVAAGVPRGLLLVDPGIGFGKRPSDNLAILRRLDAFQTLGRPIVIGVSRKRFLGEALFRAGLASRDDPSERLEASLSAAVIAALGGAVLVRAHDVAETVRSLAIADAIMHGG